MINWLNAKKAKNAAGAQPFPQGEQRSLVTSMKVTKRVELKAENSRGNLQSVIGSAINEYDAYLPTEVDEDEAASKGSGSLNTS